MNHQIQNLRFGHEPGAPLGVVNVRVSGREAGLDALAASILALGLIQPLVVVPGEGGIAYVVDGNRRLAALRALVAEEKLPSDREVPVTVREAALAREIGLGANINQAPMHDADRVQAFAELRRSGAKEKDIAVRFGQPVAQVRKLLALGGVSPAVLDAWRAGKVSEDTVKVFTMALHADQDRVLEKGLKSPGSLYACFVKRDLGLDQDVSGLLAYVGTKAFKAAGGHVVEDLFGGSNAVSDPVLLARLADERLEAECERRRREGWAWVAKATDLPMGWRWSWPQVKPAERPLSSEEQARLAEIETWLDSDDEGEEASDEQIRAAHDEAEALRDKGFIQPGPADRARSGSVILLGRDGKIEVTEYVIRPEDVPAVAPKDDKPAEPEEKGLPISLVETLCGTATEAVQAALGSSPTAGLVALLAGAMCANHWAAPMKVRLDGLGGQASSLHDKESFQDLVARLSTMSVDELLVIAAGVAARGVQTLHREHGTRPLAPSERASVQALMGLPDPSAMQDALLAKFDGEAFFKSAPKAVTLQIVGEVLGEAEARRVKDKKKKELVEFAVSSILPTGWLPAELRHPGYAGPGAVGIEPAPQALAA
ncbi:MULTISPECIES: ParB N-terminal domain-containing protein [unclassified Methylobacterium]|uniref:ParB N-terminal domain-containing protein n=1 Tax=unclassified Methylobacterium TaxID=2615210 RepID=UPI00164FB797|nr:MULTISPECIES: ParB N-terminal domain-containing protein [unclassified Methylobacterium]